VKNIKFGLSHCGRNNVLKQFVNRGAEGGIWGRKGQDKRGMDRPNGNRTSTSYSNSPNDSTLKIPRKTSI
jgi:hypothetical protein